MFDSTLTAIESNINQCRGLMDQLMECLLGCQVRDELTGLEYSKVFASVAFTLCSLHYVQQKLDGKNPGNHPITGELSRVKGYMQEIRDIMSRDDRPKLNRSAAKRIIRFLT